MQKDYVPIDTAVAAMGETSFVEQFWTDIWKQHASAFLNSKQIEKSDELRVLKPYIANLPAKARILDGGCGLGAWTVYLASKGFEVTGMDLSKEVVSQLQTRFPQSSFAAGDIRKTPFPDNHFDLYFSWGTFEHFEDGLAPCFKEAQRVLKKGGLLVISVPFQNRRHIRRSTRPLARWDEHYADSSGYSSPMRFYQWRLSRSELWREFEIHGFQCRSVEAIHKWHGLHRWVHHDVGIPGRWRFLHKAVQALSYPLVSKDYVAHMLIGVATKR